MNICSEEGCRGKIRCKNLCQYHYNRSLKTWRLCACGCGKTTTGKYALGHAYGFKKLKDRGSITQEYLKELLKYDPHTGQLIRRVAFSTNAPKEKAIGQSLQKGYPCASIGGFLYRVHQLVWLYHEGFLPEQIDHRNRVRHDNRIENLRLATSTQNHANRTMNKNKTSKYKGVSRHGKNRWQAQTKIKGEQHHLGVYGTQEEARDVYQAFMKKLHGEYFAP